jgi:hypothetical protein
MPFDLAFLLCVGPFIGAVRPDRSATGPVDDTVKSVGLYPGESAITGMASFVLELVARRHVNLFVFFVSVSRLSTIIDRRNLLLSANRSWIISVRGCNDMFSSGFFEYKLTKFIIFAG